MVMLSPSPYVESYSSSSSTVMESGTSIGAVDSRVTIGPYKASASSGSCAAASMLAEDRWVILMQQGGEAGCTIKWVAIRGSSSGSSGTKSLRGDDRNKKERK